MGSLINFSSLEEVLKTVSEQQKHMFATLERLRSDVDQMAVKDSLEEHERLLVDGQKAHDRALKRLEADAAAVVGVVQELPNLKKEVAARMSEVETKLSMELGQMQQTLLGRVQAAEKNLRGSASTAELRQLQLELGEHAKREDIVRAATPLAYVARDASRPPRPLPPRVLLLVTPPVSFSRRRRSMAWWSA